MDKKTSPWCSKRGYRLDFKVGGCYKRPLKQRRWGYPVFVGNFLPWLGGWGDGDGRKTHTVPGSRSYWIVILKVYYCLLLSIHSLSSPKEANSGYWIGSHALQLYKQLLSFQH